ncbi:MAG: DUF4019 domain-containing protein [Alphaproteobacteria bacterium]|nr:DUF4019 domain-containing protein [Alphaproteobacteria bacterium]HJP22385.1 DUF4019 domain-containing protein [Alphaproteobacteria bacterium]
MNLPKIATPVIALAALCLLLAGQPAAAADSAPEAAAKQWLALIDRGNYGEGWERAATYLQGIVMKDDLIKALKAVRTPLGAVISRRLRSAQTATSLPGMPDGIYVVIQYETVFAKKKKAVETITPMRESGGGWRVAGYYIR